MAERFEPPEARIADVGQARAEAVAEGASTDPELAQVRNELEAERLAGMLRFAQLLAERSVLRSELTLEEARDTLWTLNSLAVHDLLLVQPGWSAERYRTWLADALAGVLLRRRGRDPMASASPAPYTPLSVRRLSAPDHP